MAKFLSKYRAVDLNASLRDSWLTCVKILKLIHLRIFQKKELMICIFAFDVDNFTTTFRIMYFPFIKALEKNLDGVIMKTTKTLQWQPQMRNMGLQALRNAEHTQLKIMI